MHYRYTAANAKGKRVRGALNANDQSDAITQLQDMGLTPLELNQETAAGPDGEHFWEKDLFGKDIHKTKIKKKKLLTILNQMGIMMKAGVSLSLCMEVLIDGERDKTVKKILLEMNDDLYTGMPFSSSMQKFTAFPEIIVNIVQSGEANGRLDVAFERCAEIVEKEIALNSKIKGAMGYPCFLLFLTLVLIIIINVVVLPNFVKIFTQFDAELPGITLAVMGVSDFIMNRWYVILIVAFLLVFSYLTAKKKSPQFSLLMDQFFLKIPVIGLLLKQSYIARFCRIMASLVEAGVDIVRSLEISRDVIPNHYLKNQIEQIIADVKVGIPIHQSMSKFPVFDSLLISMIRVGEESGLLYETMDKMAALYEQQTDASTKRLTTMLEPAMTIIIAVVVGTVVISIVIPMFSMYSVVSGSAL